MKGIHFRVNHFYSHETCTHEWLCSSEISTDLSSVYKNKCSFIR